MQTEWPKTEQAWCEYLQALDRRHGTTATFRGRSGTLINDPLHHDWRCPIHGQKPHA